MKNSQQNLFVLLAIGLCALCAYQWYVQTLQRKEIEKLNQLAYEKSVAIRDYTNSIATLNHQIGQMDADISSLRSRAKSNAATIADQTRELTRLQTLNEGLTNTVSQYKQAVETMTGKLKDAYDGIEKQNAALKELVAQRDEYVKKYNDEVKDRNDIVAKYNELAAQVEKLQAGGK